MCNLFPKDAKRPSYWPQCGTTPNTPIHGFPNAKQSFQVIYSPILFKITLPVTSVKIQNSTELLENGYALEAIFCTLINSSGRLNNPIDFYFFRICQSKHQLSIAYPNSFHKQLSSANNLFKQQWSIEKWFQTFSKLNVHCLSIEPKDI